MELPYSRASTGVTTSVLVPLVAGMVLIDFYAVVASHDGFFVLTVFNYRSGPGASIFSSLPPQHVASILWKLLLLLPATLLITVGLGRAALGVSFRWARRQRLILGTLVVMAIAVLVLSTQFVFHETEVTDDENAYDFEAKTLLSGRIKNPGVSASRCFNNEFLINNGSVREGKYTLGHPAVIALGMALGNRYICLIALSALTVLLLYGISIELYADRLQALIAACLTCLSPFFYLVSSSRLSHTTSAFFLALFMYLYLRVRNSARTRTRLLLAILAGLALGYAFNVRQFTALGFAIPFCVVSAAGFRSPRPGYWRDVLFMVTGFGVMLFLTLWMNYLMTGNALLFPFNYYNPSERPGFGVHGLTPSSGIINMLLNFVLLNVVLFGFPASLMFVLPVLIAKKQFGDRLSFGIIVSIALAYAFYFFPGVSDLGPVYFYEMIIPLIPLSVRGMMVLHHFMSAHVPEGRRYVPLFVALSSILALLTVFPERAVHVARLTDQIRRPYVLVDSLQIHHAVVVIRSMPRKGFVYGYRNSSPALQDDIIYCRDADSASNAALAAMFPDRRFYLMQYSYKDDCSSISEIDRNHLSP